MIALTSERQLARIAAAIAPAASLTPVEKRLVVGPAEDATAVNVIRGLIKAGLDPLGEAFEQLRSPQARRKLGAVYTPAAIVAAMLEWARRHGTPARVVDPGAGSGRYIAAAARRWPQTKLVACEIDPLALLILRANAAALEFSHRLEVFAGDYREMPLPPIKGATLFIGNPPYVRHHDIEPMWKEWFTKAARELEFSASSLAGLHAHFFLRTRQLARDGDFGCFITSSEWLDVSYGSTIREMLGNGLGGASLHVIDATLKPFGTTMTTGAITCFEVGQHSEALGLQSITRESDLKKLLPERSVSWRHLLATKRWSIHVRPGAPKPAGFTEIGELFRVKRGLVTGCNEVWIRGSYAGPLPERFCLPTVTKGREIVDAGALLRASSLRRVLFLPRDLRTLPSQEQELIERFLVWARRFGAHTTFTARSRNPWWHIGDREAPVILSTYMGRRQPRFSLNVDGAQYLNIALGLYPRERVAAEDLAAVVDYLQGNVCTSLGRTYAGGLVKFEPSELQAVPMPSLDDLRGLRVSEVAR